MSASGYSLETKSPGQRQHSRPPYRELSSVMPPLAALPAAASAARAHVRSTLATWDMSELIEAAETVVSELVANAVNASTDDQGRPRYRDDAILMVWVALYATGTTLKAEVWDQAPGIPVINNVADDAESGRGLAMVRELCDTWDWHAVGGEQGKRVWAQFGIPEAARPARPLIRRADTRGKDDPMIATQCACGFAEQADEAVIDHLLQIFEPANSVGKDGLVHAEGNLLACLCGYSASSLEDLDAHFLAVFTPDDGIGRDGRRHHPAAGSGTP